MGMTDRHWAEVWKLYGDLREASAAERDTALASPTLAPKIREEVLVLLEQSVAVSQISGAMYGTPAVEPEYAPGREFGRYVITGLIGEGGFGRVYSAHDKQL